MKRSVIVICLVLAFPVLAAAQTPNVKNASVVTFTPNTPADHAATDKYVIGYFADATSLTVLREEDLGKPAVDGSGNCTAPINTQPLAFRLSLVARVKAVAGTIVGDWSEPSNPFDRVPGQPSKIVVK